MELNIREKDAAYRKKKECDDIIIIIIFYLLANLYTLVYKANEKAESVRARPPNLVASSNTKILLV